jgi:hypothetical protein
MSKITCHDLSVKKHYHRENLDFNYEKKSEGKEKRKENGSIEHV